MPMSVILVLCSFLVMGTAMMMRQRPRIHIPLMGSVMLFDLCFPVYLYMTHDWKKRLIDNGELFSFMIWSHLILILVLYALYVLQAMEGRAIARAEGVAEQENARQHHRIQAKGIFVVRLLVFASGLMLLEPLAAV